MAVTRADYALAYRAQQGEQAAFEEMVAPYRSALRGYLRRLGVRGEAEDLTQEVLWRTWSQVASGGYQHQGQFVAYLYGVADRVASEHRRRLARQPLPLFPEPSRNSTARDLEVAYMRRLLERCLAKALPGDMGVLKRLAFAYHYQDHQRVAVTLKRLNQEAARLGLKVVVTDALLRGWLYREIPQKLAAAFLADPEARGWLDGLEELAGEGRQLRDTLAARLKAAFRAARR
ncbi:MAG: hypothetical protein HY335_02600 [Deinococcus sp.]|nr:hypothetical protein [Deinococcus sp.]